MSKTYGMMCSYSTAIEWAEAQPDSVVKPAVIARMQYERDKTIPVKPKFHKGIYGHKFDSWSCGNCGAGIAEAHWKYCPSCGFAIGEKYENRNR